MRNVISIFILNVLLFSIGCGALHNLTEDKELRDQRSKGFDHLHIHSCGPIAIEKAYSELGRRVDRSSISKDIQDSNNQVRFILSIFSHHAREITMPSEIEWYFEKHGFQIKKIKNFNELKKDDIALILVKQKNSIYYHWLCYPPDSFITSYFGSGTIVKNIYIIKLDSKNL